MSGLQKERKGCLWACHIQNTCLFSVLILYREYSLAGEKPFRALPFTLSAPLTSKTNEFFETWKASAVGLNWSSSCCRELPSVQTSSAAWPCSAFYRKEGRSWRGRLALGKLKTDHMDYNQIKSGQGGSGEGTTLSGFLEMSVSWSLSLRIWREVTFSAMGRGGPGLDEINPQNENYPPDNILLWVSSLPLLCLILLSEIGVRTCLLEWWWGSDPVKR